MSLLATDAPGPDDSGSVIDALLLHAARASVADLPSLISSGAAALGARAISAWLIGDDAPHRCIACFPGHDTPADPAFRDRLPLLKTQRTVVFRSGEYIDLVCALWRNGVVIGLLHLDRPATLPWTDTERAAAAALADRVAFLLERELIEAQMSRALDERTEEALRALESYRTIFDSSNDAIFLHDLETGAILDANRTACEVNGYTREELRSRGTQLIGNGPPPFTEESALAYIARAAAGEPQRFEWCTLHQVTGEEMWVEVGLQRVAIRGEGRLLALVRDIRERKRAEAVLRRANEELELRVAERTDELASANLALEEEVAEHELAREQLLQRTAELEGIFRALPDLYFRIDRDGTVRDFRAGDAGRLAVAPDFFVGKRLQDVMPAEIGEQTEAALLKLAETGELVHFEYVITHAGELRDYEARFVPHGSHQAIIVVRDITERKQAERAVAEREERFRALVENAHDITSIIDTQGRMLYTTPAFSRILGYDIEDMIGQNIFDYYHPDDVQRDVPLLASLVAHPGTVGRTHHRIRHKDGSWRHLEAFGRTFSPHTAADGIVVNIRDITESVQAAEALRASEEHFRRLIENSSDQLMIADTTGAITYVGPSIERLLGYTPEEMIGTRPVDLVHPDDVPAVMATLEQIVAHPDEIYTIEYRIRHKDGSWRVFENVGKTFAPDSAAEGVVANGRDVTERRRAEEALREASAAAERANRAKSEFLSRMSHELRTPMNSILGFAQVLEGAELPARLEKSVQHILRAGRHLLQLINEVLEISRIEAGRQHLSLEPVRLDAIVQEAIGLARPMATQAHIGLEYATFAPGDAYVRADRQRLAQVLLNLLANAIKYNRADGHVRLSCEPAPAPPAGARRLRIRVADTGRGIPLERQPELFTPFARLGAENSEIEGTGLGLALSHRLAEAMGGSLILEQSSDEGSVFCIELELTQSPLEQMDEHGATRRPRGAAPHAPATLLYIEDNLANLSLVETILWERPRWRTIPALQGQIGVDLAREHVPDLILLDLHLPDMRGEEVLRRLRSEPRTAAIPVVVISADATESAIQRLLAAGAVAFLTKPLDVAEFLATLERLLAPRNA